MTIPPEGVLSALSEFDPGFSVPVRVPAGGDPLRYWPSPYEGPVVARGPGLFARDLIRFPVPTPVGPVVLEVDMVVASPDRWRSSVEATQGDWHLARDDHDVVVAIRALA